MSVFLNSRYKALVPYTPGEQPQGKPLIKLNTNESPFPPSEKVLAVLNRTEGAALRLYPDPTAKGLKEALASTYGVQPENVFAGNGSDEALNFAFMAFGEDGAAFPDITYGFYQVFAALHGIAADVKPLTKTFQIDIDAYRGAGKLTVLANPNAPTGLVLSLAEIEALLKADPQHVFVVDEAYIDFAAPGTSAIPLTKQYKNLLVVQTYSKSRSMAGARVGYAIGDAALIQDLERIRYSTNPYNLNRISLAAAQAALLDSAYYEENAKKIIKTREKTKAALLKLGFTCTDSQANFLFAAHPKAEGEALYQALKDRGILVRHFDKARISAYNRITIGTDEQMEALLLALREILGNS